jgi:hypothetical protein
MNPSPISGYDARINERIGAALTLMEMGHNHLAGEGYISEAFMEAARLLNALAEERGVEPSYAWNPGNWQAAFHQCSLALAGAFDSSRRTNVNARINAIREELIHGLEYPPEGAEDD